MRLIPKSSNEWNFAEFNDPGRFFHQEETKSPEQLAQEEEARKEVLRRQLNRVFGFDDPSAISGYRVKGSDKVYGSMEEARKAATQMGLGVNSEPQYYDNGDGNFSLNPNFYAEDPVETIYGDSTAGAARKQMADEDEKVSTATRNYYTDALGRAFTKAERNTRFNLARQGLMGGSEDTYQQGENRSDRDLGGTRIDEATRRAVTSLKGSREDARLKGIGLINAGAGDEGVRSAAAGLRQSFDTAINAQKADLTADLFSGAIDNYTLSQNQAANQALLARYRQQLATSFPSSGGNSGRVTPTQ